MADRGFVMVFPGEWERDSATPDETIIEASP